MKFRFPKILKNSDRILSVSAVLISLGTLYILIHQTNLNRKQFELSQRQLSASVLPYLELASSSPNEKDYELILFNNGLGPAFIKGIRIHYKNKVYNQDPARFLQNKIFLKDSLDFYFTDLYVDRLLPAGNTLKLLTVKDDEHSASHLKKLYSEKQAKIEIEYASAFDERWLIKGFGTYRKKIDKE